MTGIKALMEGDFVTHHGIHVSPQAEVVSTDEVLFDLDDMPSPVAVLAHGQGKLSLTNDTYGGMDILAYEKFINQCTKPASFLNGRKKCDYLAVHESDEGYALLIELTSALGTAQNLEKPIDKFPGGKYEKSEVQLASSLTDLLAVAAVGELMMARQHRVCLVAYRVSPHTDPDYLMKHPFERYLRVESKATAEDGAIVPCVAINSRGFEYRRISHEYSYRLAAHMSEAE